MASTAARSPARSATRPAGHVACPAEFQAVGIQQPVPPVPETLEKGAAQREIDLHRIGQDAADGQPRPPRAPAAAAPAGPRRSRARMLPPCCLRMAATWRGRTAAGGAGGMLHLQRVPAEQEFGRARDHQPGQQRQRQQQQHVHRAHLDGADLLFARHRQVVALAEEFGFEFQGSAHGVFHFFNASIAAANSWARRVRLPAERKTRPSPGCSSLPQELADLARSSPGRTRSAGRSLRMLSASARLLDPGNLLLVGRVQLGDHQHVGAAGTPWRTASSASAGG